MQRIDRQQLRAPARVVDLELSAPPGATEGAIDVSGYRSVWCLARRNGLPRSVSFWDVADYLTVHERDLVAGVTAPSGGTAPSDPDGLGTAGDGYGYGYDAGDDGVGLTVAICTHERPADLGRALDSLAGQHDRDFSTLVIDNAPRSRATADVVTRSPLDRCDYLIEPQKGLSRARNTALAHVGTDLMAWMDDDEMADPDWIGRIKQGFRHPSGPVAVCGVMLPAELETDAQVLFEQYGGFNKGRGLDPEALTTGSPTVVSPLYPLPAVGSGGNMAFRTAALRGAGGFDPDLGAGTRTHGGEETKVFATLLRSGGTVLHWPAAITWHVHRRGMDELERQFYGYSAGLTAFYASMIRSEPSTVWEMARLVPHALRDLGLRDGGIRSEEVPEDFPAVLLAAGRRGLLTGAFHYVSESLRSRAGGWRV